MDKIADRIAELMADQLEMAMAERLADNRYKATMHKGIYQGLSMALDIILADASMRGNIIDVDEYYPKNDAPEPEILKSRLASG